MSSTQDFPDIAHLSKELDTISELAETARHEILHYTKHVVRARWQHKEEQAILKQMRGNPQIKRSKSDHSNKTLAQNLFEAMSEYISKHGISNLGHFV
jgi:predicted SprT family Zn-dependent metalloprotease